jgi:hypothetical protein
METLSAHLETKVVMSRKAFELHVLWMSSASQEGLCSIELVSYIVNVLLIYYVTCLS